MANAKTFGRKAPARAPAPRAAKAPLEFGTPVKTPEPVAEPTVPLPLEASVTTPSVDDEVDAWKKTRKVSLPWRQLRLLASLFFGVASLALTGTVGETVDWLLYGLSAASFFWWWRREPFLVVARTRDRRLITPRACSRSSSFSAPDVPQGGAPRIPRPP
jgi:hypothetical protein